MEKGKIVIFSAPSGSGKTTILRYLMEHTDLPLEFSISATSRSARPGEKNGIDYHFLSENDFRERILRGEFLEWEEVYPGTYYGTLKNELTRIWNKGKVAALDVDVKGGLNIRQMYPDNSMAVFIQPPSVEELERRLIARDTDPADKIAIRVAKARQEMAYADRFDAIVINDDLKTAERDAENIIRNFLKK